MKIILSDESARGCRDVEIDEANVFRPMVGDRVIIGKILRTVIRIEIDYEENILTAYCL